MISSVASGRGGGERAALGGIVLGVEFWAK